MSFHVSVKMRSPVRAYPSVHGCSIGQLMEAPDRRLEQLLSPTDQQKVIKLLKRSAFGFTTRHFGTTGIQSLLHLGKPHWT
jgi:hypothetical protein